MSGHSPYHVRHLGSADYTRSEPGLWQSTRIAIHPPGADRKLKDFGWMVTRAQSSSSGPFASYPRHQRITMFLAGAGMRLTHTDATGNRTERILDRPFDPYRYSGAWTTEAELTDGPVTDLNVIYDGSRGQTDMGVFHLTRRLLHSCLNANVHLFYCIKGLAAATIGRSGDSFCLETDQTILLESDPKDRTPEDEITLTALRADTVLAGIHLYLSGS